MKPFGTAWFGWVVLALSLCTGSTAQAQVKPIYLRHQAVEAGQARLPAAAARERKAELYLIQFREPLQPAWRQELRAAGVKLLRYVPEDTFVARFDVADAERVRGLAYVGWVGEYSPEHKVHGKVRQDATARPAELLNVSILLAPETDPRELKDVERELGKIHRQTHMRFGIVLRGEIAPARLDVLVRLPAVLWVEPGSRIKLYDEVASEIVGGDGGTGLTYVQALGYDGLGVSVAVADTGLHNGDALSMHPDLYGRVSAFFQYGDLPDAADEHSHGTHVAGIIGGNGATGEVDESGALYGLGVAPQAQIVVQRLFDRDGNYTGPTNNYWQLTSQAVQAGAEIGSNSWGDDTQGRYDLSAAEFDELVRDADPETPGDQPYILEFSAGNAGDAEQTIGSPAVGKNVIATGASQNNRIIEFDPYGFDQGQEAMAGFSSRGPCEDGRIKPDLVAPGTWIASLKSASATDENAWLPISDNYMFQGGTSQAGPHVSGAAAVFVQYYREFYGGTPSPALVKAALLNSAVDMADEMGTSPVPNMEEGWGRLDLTELIAAPQVYHFVDQTVRLSTGQTHEQRVLLGNAELPLKITLAYTDVPALPSAARALVNDLDLEVVGPDGRIYRGNQFAAGESVPNASQFDPINNVEAVHFLDPQPGEYLIRVRARNVPEDALGETPAVDQDFALVLSGDLPPPNTSAITLDRRAYTVPDQITIQVLDPDMAGQAGVTVTVLSTTEPGGEPLRLQPLQPWGLFIGTMATVTGTPARDGRLQIAHGDQIEAVYQYGWPPNTRTAVAVADLVPPVITDVVARNRFGTVTVTWQTDEPASSWVVYGTDPGLGLSAGSERFRETHSITLRDLATNTTYYFAVVSMDRAGNTTIADNNGALFRFVAMPAATVLLVDAYTDPLFEVPPLAGYTDALDQAGVTYEVWDLVSENAPSPTLDDLRPFQLVIWRLPEFITGTAFSSDERVVISSYLNAGGALLVASMEAPSRIDEGSATSFRTGVLQIADYEPDAGAPFVCGSDEDPLTSGIALELDYQVYDDPFKEFLMMPADVSDIIVPGTNATPILFDSDDPATRSPVGLRYPRTGVDAPGRLIYLSFPLDAVPLATTTSNTHTRGAFLGQLLTFLVPGFNGVGSVSLDRSAYTLPSVVTIEVADSDLQGQGEAFARLASQTEPAGAVVALRETARRGVFRGSINLVAVSAPTGPGQLRAAPGEILRATYFDASLNRTNTATAVVDTTPAVITAVEAIPDYIDALVVWNTSEPADSLVQYGPSRLLGQVAFDLRQTESHYVSLVNLEPDRTYYYQVVSRDTAGNVQIDDNGGQQYTFRTLRPLMLPWSDNLETGVSGWEVFSDELSEVVWELGIPNNGWETEAKSPDNAWGSSLNGESTGYAQTFLISPAILLSGGSQATLRFWHSYDFTEKSIFDIAEGGIVYIITNRYTDPVPLAVFDMDTYTETWEEAVVDLSPHIGKLVYLVWYYELLSFDFETYFGRPGWLVDDISVNVTGTALGTIVISNNLAHAPFTLSGPLAQTGLGSQTYHNAPVGDYTVTFQAVPFYQAPPPQLGTLTASAPLRLEGRYQYADANANGISDTWEQQHFGAVSPDRTALTDTDGDGSTDRAEFMAGTDPKQPASRLALDTPAVGPRTLQLQWSSSSGRIYRVEGSVDAVHWTPVSDWIQAAGATTTFTLPTPAPRAPFLFRVEVRP